MNVLSPFFEGVPFDAASLNFTSGTFSTWHRDFKNLVWGVCCIGPLGNFDHKVSGQFMMEELRMIVELRPGDLFFVPSGAIRHCNAPVKGWLRGSEKRYSIVFYSAAGNFRWIANDFETEKDGKKIGQDQKEKIAEGKRRWEDGWKLFSTLSELNKMGAGSSVE